ncbi:hypothetical protein PV08_11053 [Exophiala spinifera]|uniref:Extradiol ring-cleavage dioxygenase class III enzyme subunit B domain-containing protein n=1 Tax=Exophiala spinifera TaxID=91928 RepID=A0A0D2ATP6_9EURO|nr:uncharacterized protein PV08_11053 [Exophiala spinifera]KIW10093.1 hypothetical protein PV08_11053 [Exophiala spinifera]
MQQGLTPVYFFSHGSTMMLGEESASADFWKACGDEALQNKVKGIIMMGAHWDCKGHNTIEVAMNPNPGKSPIAYVDPRIYKEYKLVPDLETGQRCIDILQRAHIDAKPNPSFEWIHDTFLVLIRMFPQGMPPTVLLSLNARYDPHFHMRIGSILRPLRKEGYIFVGTGGAVHNLYRNKWGPMVKYRDNFAMTTPPEGWALEFRQAVEDVITKNSGPSLRRAMTRLLKHPEYRDAHGTDEHFMPALFVAGAAGDAEDEGVYGRLGAEDWELTNMCNSQFIIGCWA